MGKNASGKGSRTVRAHACHGGTLKGIENRVEFDASPRTVFKAISDPGNLPAYVPGVESAETLAEGIDGIGTLVDLTTRRGRHLEAVVTGEAKNAFFAIQDARGTLLEWELRPTSHGTLAVQRILGDFRPGEATELEEEARAKLWRFKKLVDGK